MYVCMFVMPLNPQGWGGGMICVPASQTIIGSGFCVT